MWILFACVCIPCDSRKKDFSSNWKNGVDFSKVDWDAKLAAGLYDNGIALVLGELLAIIGKDDRKEDGLKMRRKITLHSFRRFVKIVISDQVGQDYSEWFLGHSKPLYYTKKETERREVYATRCIKYLTFLDYTTLETTGKNIEAKLSEKEKEIQLLRKHQELRDDALTSLSDQVTKLVQEIEILKQQKH